jgi:nitroimidazol reductase NimA-like FMN-containing flavoprotein (pyridoxamine 5'-phosphate oxidase superfamily)
MPPKRARPKIRYPKASRPHMPGYGLADAASGKGLLPWRWARERLSKSHNYWIATTRPDSSPHVMLVWGLWLDEAFYFSTGRESRKARNLSGNPHCVISTDNSAEAVIVEGVAKEIPILEDAAFLKKYIKLYKQKYNWQMDGSEGNFYIVRPRVVFGLLEKDFLGATTRWQFADD